MKTRDVVGLVWPVVLLLAIAGTVWMSIQFWPLKGHVTRMNCDRIEPGMSRMGVEDLLGGPGWKPDCGTGVPPGEVQEFWDGFVCHVRVDFDRRRRVIRTTRY